MAIVPSLLYRGTLGNTSTTLKTTDSNATTTITNIVASNRTSTAGWFTVTINGFYVAYQMPVAGNQTVTLDVKQSIPAGTAIAGLANAASTIDLHISGAVNTGPSDLPWTAYTPTLTASTTNPTNWTQTGYYMQVGKLVVARFSVVASASFTAGNGTYAVGLPVAGNTTMGDVESGIVRIFYSGGQAFGWAHVLTGAPTTMRINYQTSFTAVNGIGSATPGTWAAGSAIRGQIVYEAA